MVYAHFDQAVERKTRSPVALKMLFDEAFYHFIHSNWPTSLDDAVHFGGLLMQIRFGDHDPKKHNLGFLRDALETFVPAHLLHNQLKSTEWERRKTLPHLQLSLHSFRYLQGTPGAQGKNRSVPTAPIVLAVCMAGGRFDPLAVSDMTH